MNEDLKVMADAVGSDTVAATRAINEAIALTARSLATLVEGSERAGSPELGSGREAMRIIAALGSMVSAHRAQVFSRIAMLRKAATLQIPDYGENCPCGGGIDSTDRVSAEACLALS